MHEIAEELVALYRRRLEVSGHAFGPDTPWQAELESSFPFVETVDQLRAIEEVKEDMERPLPMDRLVCGDVGFGKTEVAIRAVFKAVQDGFQAAVLVPTTLLASQHAQTFAERYAPFPMRVELLSRFLTNAQAKAVLGGLADGSVDVVVGTHRLLGEDVTFEKLGLLVVDEEQRFGVTHKESIKAMADGVDVLTLTASPIPRTLEMALTGIRDLSMVNTPPAARRPILTHVGEYEEAAASEAIRRELLREGQVFYVHNRVQDIEAAAQRVRGMAPEARVAVAHGQMDEGSLEQVVLDFWEGLYDVLVCTTIIESGIDMPTVNTLVVDRADLLGLGQLHQLRGRVGRAGQRAYAYLFHPVDRVLSEQAYERLRTIGDHTELGSGFKIALRDLQIRGAGNLLGRDQSGHIAAIGYDLYVQMVSEAVADLKGEPRPQPVDLKLDLPDARPPAGHLRRGRGRPPRGLPPAHRGADRRADRGRAHRVGGPVRSAPRAGRRPVGGGPAARGVPAPRGHRLRGDRPEGRDGPEHRPGQGEAVPDHAAGLGRGQAAPAGPRGHLPGRSAPAAPGRPGAQGGRRVRCGPGGPARRAGTGRVTAAPVSGPTADSIAAVKRQLPAAVVALVVVATGVLASACDVTPPAASANGSTISTASLNTQLQTLQTTAAGGCLLQLENAQLAATTGEGAGGAGTYSMTFANAVLSNQIGDLLTEQLAASKGIVVTPADVAAAQSEFESELSGAINQAVQQASQSGTISFCQDASGASVSGKALLAALPASIKEDQVRNQAVVQKLRAHGADLSDAAVAAYYNANLAQFTTSCVSVIVTDTQAHADQLVAQINAGASFESVAKASSLDSRTAANGGSLGCSYTEAQVEQSLQVQSVTAGQPIAPVQDSSTGQWIIYEVTSQTVAPLSAAGSLARRELLQSTANINRVNKEIVAFARSSDVSIDPEYGTWKLLSIAPPASPPSQFLLGAVSGQTPLVSRPTSGG